ncbi:methyltransferase [Streptomyces rubellomurinus subsp. indigoferus]|uniref:Methyltransferase n=1 Tax=Streptomyces rubellomurinus (strain ATCC 31215) TaxID=359131 RepID=A0A0F2TDU0_STRR3|nr:class I SAM-dependent methyltransferase [Streptomyces rubellomurinus]KJS55313.1 methyltransferase [Streptomyces rubellomurinus subsp. indigoferus]KJS60455.1 methyltransferase [Streptomyces rubellomurinus]
MTDHRDYREAAASFGAVAAEYDRGRPGYPGELFDEVERLWGRGLKGARVLDVGAGTGIATRLLAARGAEVVAVEPSGGMAAQFAASSPTLPLVRGTGDDLPFHDGSADLITYAQAFHWTYPERSVPEAVRVLRPGGALAAWWNVHDETVPWVRARDERMAAALPDRYRGYGGIGGHTGHFAPAGLRVERVVLRWVRQVTVEHVLTDLTSRSYLASLGPGERAPILAAEREAMLAEFPDGVVVEPFALDLTVAVKPG